MSVAGGTFPYVSYDALGDGDMSMPHWDRDRWGDAREFSSRHLNGLGDDGAMFPGWNRDSWGDARSFWPRNLNGLGACPGSSPTVIVEATQIPTIVWWIAGGFALWMVLKRR